MFNSWVFYQKTKWTSYLNHVSDWERSRYLRFFKVSTDINGPS